MSGSDMSQMTSVFVDLAMIEHGGLPHDDTVRAVGNIRSFIVSLLELLGGYESSLTVDEG
jgi:hypothetical protein